MESDPRAEGTIASGSERWEPRDPRVHVVVNPAAGGGRVAARQLQILDRLRARFGAFFGWSTTWGSGAAATLAHQAALTGVGLVVAVGGDGTVHEVANGVLDARGPGSAIGLLDVASEGGFAESLGLPTRLEHQLERIEQGTANAVDVGRVICQGRAGRLNARFFVNECQIGLGAEICGALQTVAKPQGGRVHFGWRTLRTGLARRALPMEISVDGEEPKTLELLGVVVANGAQCGCGLRFAGDAKIDDGWLDVLLIHDVPRASRPLFMARAFHGRQLEEPHATYLRVKRITVGTQEPVDITADGESIGATPCGIQIRTGALEVLH